MNSTDVFTTAATTTTTAATTTTTAPNQTAPPPSPYLEPYWLISESVLVLVTLFTVYLLICLGRYALISRCKPGRELNHKKGKTLYRLCFISVLMALGRFAADQAVAVVGWQTDRKCYASVSTSIAFYTMSLYPVYIFLWMRQSIFYANPVLSHILNPVVTFISYATLFIMLAGGAALGVLYIMPSVTGWSHEATANGCMDVNNSSASFDLIPLLVVCFVVSFQISLLALFLYPLLTKKMQKYRRSGKGGPSSNGSGKGGHQHSKDFSSTESAPHNHRGGQAASVTTDKSAPLPPPPRPRSFVESCQTSETDFSRSGTLNADEQLGGCVGKPPRIARPTKTPPVFQRSRKPEGGGGGGGGANSVARMAAANATAAAKKEKKAVSSDVGSSSEGEGKKPKRFVKKNEKKT